jgi:hypothetical protein
VTLHARNTADVGASSGPAVRTGPEALDAELPTSIVDLRMLRAAYQASLAATSRVVQPSLLDFLR